MPFVDVSLPEDEIKLFYRTNLPNDDISLLHQPDHRPIVILLNPFVLDISFLGPQFHDPLLSDTYTLLAFDALAHGRTSASLYASTSTTASKSQSASQDEWVNAALIAAFCDALGIQEPVHVFSSGAYSLQTALRFAVQWPELCASLIIGGVGPIEFTPPIAQSYIEWVDAWLKADNLESLHELIQNVEYIAFNGTLNQEELDTVIAQWQYSWGPAHATKLLAMGPVSLSRVPLSPAEIASIQCPVLIMQGELVTLARVEDAETLFAQLSRTPSPGPQLEIIPGAPSCITYPSSCAATVNERADRFLREVLFVRKTTTGLNVKEVNRNALKRSVEWASRPDMASRDPQSIFSFSRETEEGKERRFQLYTVPWAELERTAFDPFRAAGTSTIPKPFTPVSLSTPPATLTSSTPMSSVALFSDRFETFFSPKLNPDPTSHGPEVAVDVGVALGDDVDEIGEGLEKVMMALDETLGVAVEDVIMQGVERRARSASVVGLTLS